MKGKNIALAISAGIPEEDYQTEGEYGATIDQIILPFTITISFIDSNYKGSFVLYNTHNAPQTGALERSALDYIDFATKV